MVTESRLERLASGLAPVTPGWFIVNTADAAWVDNEWYGGVCIFESDHIVLQGRPDLTEYEKPGAGFTIRVVPPGQPSGGLSRRVGPRGLPRLDGRVHAHHRRPGTTPEGMGLRALPADDRARVRRQGNRAMRDPRHGKPARRSPNWWSLDPRSRSATARDPSAEGHGWSSGPNTGTSSRGLTGRSSRRVRCGIPTECRSASNEDRPYRRLGQCPGMSPDGPGFTQGRRRGIQFAARSHFVVRRQSQSKAVAFEPWDDMQVNVKHVLSCCCTVR